MNGEHIQIIYSTFKFIISISLRKNAKLKGAIIHLAEIITDTHAKLVFDLII